MKKLAPSMVLESSAARSPLIATSSTRRVRARAVLVPYVVSRLISDSLVIVIAALGGHGVLGNKGFAHSDGHWYEHIARLGYPAHVVIWHRSDWAFFPLLPLMMRVAGWFTISAPFAAVLINHVAFLVALIGLQRLMARRYSPRATNLAIWAIALFPAAIAFSMIYPSALLLAGSVWAFVFLDEHRYVLAGLCATAATMARPNGFWIIVAIAIAIGFDFDRLLRACGPPAAALGAWMLFNLRRTGDALTFFRIKRAWREVTALGLIRHPTPGPLIHLMLAAGALALIAIEWRRLPRAWSALTVLYVVPSLALGIVGMGRYANESFAPFAAAGNVLDRSTRTVRAFVFTGLIAGQIAFAYWILAVPRQNL